MFFIFNNHSEFTCQAQFLFSNLALNESFRVKVWSWVFVIVVNRSPMSVTGAVLVVQRMKKLCVWLNDKKFSVKMNVFGSFRVSALIIIRKFIWKIGKFRWSSHGSLVTQSLLWRIFLLWLRSKNSLNQINFNSQLFSNV